MFCHEVNEQTIEAFSRGIPSGIAVDTATFGAVVASLLVAAAKVSGIDPPDELPDLYEEHPLVQGGGWICGHGRIVRVLGIDSRDRVAYEVDGALASHERRPTVDAFLDHYTRIDDVPELGGEG